MEEKALGVGHHIVGILLHHLIGILLYLGLRAGAEGKQGKNDKLFFHFGVQR